jgi:hypothetical protein
MASVLRRALVSVSQHVSERIGHLKLKVYRNENRSYLLKLLFYAGRTVTGRLKFRTKTAAAILVGKWRYKKVVPYVMLQVCSACQHKCGYCAHADLIQAAPGYQLSMEDLIEFISRTEKSNYYIESVTINGPGEPTLWKEFNEGVALLYRSRAIGNLRLTTNGQSLDRVDEQTWRYLSRVTVSVYPSSRITEFEHLKSRSRLYGFYLTIKSQDVFRVHPDRCYRDSLPACCMCPGPMIYGRRVYLYCGPSAFGAAALKGEEYVNNPKYSREVGLDYLHGVDTPVLYGGESLAIMTMDLCRYCWANQSISLEQVTHQQSRTRYATLKTVPR